MRQYRLPGLEDMLLSPRSKRRTDETLTFCEECFKSLAKSRGSDDGDYGPPKKAIANGFACGHIPNKFELKNEDGTTTVVTMYENDLTDIFVPFSVQRDLTVIVLHIPEVRTNRCRVISSFTKPI